MTDTTPITALIIDAGPLISSTSTDVLLARAQKVYTTPSVVAEIRDAATRARLETAWLPFIQQRTPKAESVRVVSDFAKKTGDFSVLSVTDLQLLALTYELEVENNGGDWRLRRVPGQKGVNGPVPKVKKERGRRGGGGRVDEKVEKVDEKVEDKPEEKEEKEENPEEKTEEKKEEKAEEKVEENLEKPEETPDEKLQATETSTPQETKEPDETTKDISKSLESTHLAPSDSDPSDSDSDSGWITPANIHLHKARDAATPSDARPSTTTHPMAAALATTDFAMQNVLLQMNLHLVSPNGLHRIRMVKTWVLRCHACFKVCRDMNKQFCPSCGGATLLRTSCSTDSKGVFTLHLKRNFQWNNRGNVYSIPKTQHGSASGKGVKKNLILREDQVEYQREVRQRERQKERDLLDPDYLPGILTGERRDVAGGRPTVGYGRQNPNQRRAGGRMGKR